MKAVILAGGLGTRISEETHLKPKPMIEIGGKPILWHIMKIYSAHGINEFIIGRDGRLSSPDIFEWLSSGVISTGCGLIDIGIVTSPMFYHSTFSLNSSSGVVITGSHNPGEYNGFKIVFNNQSYRQI